MNEIVKTFEFGNKVINLKMLEYENDINVDDVLKIDYSNILGEVLTFSVLLNRFGSILAEIEDYLRKSTYDLELQNNKIKQEEAKAKTRAYQMLINEGVKTPTIPQTADRAMSDKDLIALQEEYNQMKFKHIDLQHTRDQINNLYWAAKSKDEKLNKITEKIRPVEFEGSIVDGKINGILIKVNEKLIK